MRKKSACKTRVNKSKSRSGLVTFFRLEAEMRLRSVLNFGESKSNYQH